MTADDRFDRDLIDWLQATAPVAAPAGLHAAAIGGAGALRQRPGWLVTVRGATFGQSARLHGWPRTALALGLVALLTLAAVAAVLLATHRPPSRLGGNGAIVFHWQGNGHAPGGTTFIEADGDPGTTQAHGCATFSDDGRYLIYPTSGGLALDPMDGSSITKVKMDLVSHWIAFRGYELSPDSTRIARLTPGQRVTAPPYPDGSTSEIETGNEMWVSPVSGGEGIRIVPGPKSGLETYLQPTWSPDGSQVAFLAAGWDPAGSDFDYRGSTIVIAQADGSGVRRLETGRALGDVVAWSPDGKRLAYLGLPDGELDPSGPSDVFVMSVDGTDRTNITNSPAIESEQAWSPDGSAVAFLTQDEDGSNLALVPISDGSPSGPVNDGPETSLYTWSPDGQRILFVDSRTEPAPWDGASATSFSVLRTIDRRFVDAPSGGFGEVEGSVLCHLAWQRLP